MLLVKRKSNQIFHTNFHTKNGKVFVIIAVEFGKILKRKRDQNGKVVVFMAQVTCSVCGCTCDESIAHSCPECGECVCDECATLYEGYCKDCFDAVAQKLE